VLGVTDEKFKEWGTDSSKGPGAQLRLLKDASLAVVYMKRPEIWNIFKDQTREVTDFL